jgi:ferritin-like metal-binding protein YciE
MGLSRKDIRTFEDLLLHGLEDIYYAENKIVRSLPELIEHASDAGLRRALELHLRQTRRQVARLERAFRLLGEEPRAVRCYGIHGLVSEGQEVLGSVADREVLNAAVIAAAQAVERYEITRYGSLVAWAGRIGRADVAGILQESLAEEKAADDKLTALAQARVGGGAQRRNAAAPRRAPAPRRQRVGGDRRASSRK